MDETVVPVAPQMKPKRKHRRRQSSDYEYFYEIDTSNEKDGKEIQTKEKNKKLTQKLTNSTRSIPANYFSQWPSAPVAQTQKPSWSVKNAVSASISSAYQTFRHPISSANQLSSHLSTLKTSTTNTVKNVNTLLEKLVDKDWCRRHKLIVVLVLLGIAACCAVGLWGLVAVVVGFAFVGLLLWMLLL